MPHELSSAYFLTIQLHLFVYFLAYSPGLCLSFSPSYLNIPHSLGGLGLWRYWYLCLKSLPLVASTSFSYYLINTFVVVQSLSCAQLCNSMDCSMPAFPLFHNLPEFTQTHVLWVGDAIQTSHPLSSPFPPASNLSQHQWLFQWVSSWYPVAKVLELQLQHQSFQWILSIDFP